MSDMQYPIGRFAAPAAVADADLEHWMGVIEQLPEDLSRAVSGLAEQQLDTPYRPGGWTVRQVVHHIADSHLNSYVRFRLALTETNPEIKPYEEGAWAYLEDARAAPIEASLQLLAGLHTRWVLLLRSLTNEQWQRTFRHPERGSMRLDMTAALYAWHSRHHVAHIVELRKREGW